MITVIGGFGFNAKPLQFLYSLIRQNIEINFIDINLFSAIFTLNDMSDFVLGETKENKGKNILIAYSMGGLLAFNLALRQLHAFDKIILINSTPKFIADDNWHGIKDLDFQRLQKKLEDSSIENFMKYFTSLVAIPERIRDWGNYSSWWSGTSKEQLRNLLQILSVSDFRQDIYKLSKKLIMINAINDVLIKNNNLPITTHWLDNATHIQVEKAKETIRQIINNAIR